jgi:hypothetical protein
MTAPTLEQLMKLVQDEGYFYTRDTGSSSEIRFAKRADDQGPAGWGWRIQDIGSYERFDIDSATLLFNEKRVNFNVVQAELLSNIAASAAYHRQRTKAINKVMGVDYTDEAEKSMEKFGSDLVKMIDGAIRKSKIKLVED